MTQPQPPQPPKLQPGKKVRLIVLGVAGLFGLCCSAAYVATKEDGDPEASRNVALGGKIGTAVRDGKFEFVVRSVQCGVGRLGPDHAEQRAQGQFCLVSLTVKNIGDQPQIMSDEDQRAFGTNGKRYRANTDAGLFANEPGNHVWLTQINPGAEVRGTIVYDLPRGIGLSQLELHDSMISGGVRVELR